MIKVISFKICPFVQRVTALLEAKNISYELKYISLSNKPDWFLDISPNAQVPVLVTENGTALLNPMPSSNIWKRPIPLFSRIFHWKKKRQTGPGVIWLQRTILSNAVLNAARLKKSFTLEIRSLMPPFRSWKNSLVKAPIFPAKH